MQARFYGERLRSSALLEANLQPSLKAMFFRDFFRGANDSVGRVADRLRGSASIYGQNEREAEESVTFAACLDVNLPGSNGFDCDNSVRQSVLHLVLRPGISER